MRIRRLLQCFLLGLIPVLVIFYQLQGELDRSTSSITKIGTQISKQRISVLVMQPLKPQMVQSSQQWGETSIVEKTLWLYC